MALPTYGADATGADSYTEVIAARSSDTDAYNYAVAWCSTYGAILSFDGGTTDHVALQAGAAPLKIEFDNKTGAVHAKNASAGQNYTNLYVVIGNDRGR